MTAGESLETSFGQVADDYDRVRPGPPEEALDWLVPRDCQIAIDVAAGTGLFSRALLHRAGQVIAVEPDDRMRAVLAARSPGVRVVAGRGEAIPVPDASADGVFVSAAWHWLDPGQAVPEIARVLRDGGRLGVIWANWDRRAGWAVGPGMFPGPRTARTAGDARSRPRPRYEVTLPENAPFENIATARVAGDTAVTAVAHLARRSLPHSDGNPEQIKDPGPQIRTCGLPRIAVGPRRRTFRPHRTGLPM